MPSDLTTSIMKSAPTGVVVSGGGGGASGADCSMAPAIDGAGFGGGSCAPADTGEREHGGEGKRVEVGVDIGGRRVIKKKKIRVQCDKVRTTMRLKRYE